MTKNNEQLQKFLASLTDRDRKIWLDRLRAKKASQRFSHFVKYTMPDFQFNWHSKIMCDEIDDFLNDPNRNRLMIFAPPRRGKSEIVSRRLPAYFAGKYPQYQMLATSYGDDLAQRNNKDVQRIIQSEAYKKIFPNTRIGRLPNKKKDDIDAKKTGKYFDILNKVDPEKNGYYASAGVEGPLTGLGFHLGLIDDPIKNMQEALSDTRKKAIYDWYDSTFITREMPEYGKVIIILTRWSETDLAGRLLADAEANEDADQWEVICFPEEFDPNHPYIHELDPRTETGQLLHPERFTPEKVKRRKAGATRKVWASLYQQLPTPEGGNVFKREDFKYYKELPENIEYLALSIDCSFKETNTSDYVATGVWGISGSNKYALYVNKERMDLPKTIKHIKKVHKDFLEKYGVKIRVSIVEDKANGPAVISVLKNKIEGMIAYSPKESKISRAHAASFQVEAGNIWLPDPNYSENRIQRPWCVQGVEDFLTEVTGFPYAANDDLVDMMTQMIIKIGDKANWMDELLGDQFAPQPVSNEERFKEELAELMGWDIDDSPTMDNLMLKQLGEKKRLL